MLPLMVLACLSGAPDQCEVTRQGTFSDQASCQAAGRLWAAAAAPGPGDGPGQGLDDDPGAGQAGGQADGQAIGQVEGQTHRQVKQAWTCGTGEFWIAEVAPGVFVHKGHQAEPGPRNRADTANIGYIVGNEAVAIIDAGGSDAVAQALLDDIRARTDLPVRYLVLTHMHPDHVMGAGPLLDAGAVALAHPAFAAGLAARYDHYHAAYARDVGPDWSASSAPPETVAAPDTIDLGDRVLDLRRHGTGHTTNDLSVFDRATKSWFLGDLVFLGHMPAIDASVTGWQAALRTAAAQPADRVIPGHGPVSAPWPAAAEPTGHYLSGLIETLRAEIAAGTPLIDLVTAASEAEMPGWLLSDTFHPRNVTTAYRELEWE